MNKSISLPQFPKVVTDLAYQNQFLKVVTYSLMGMLSVLMIAVIFFCVRGPRVIALTDSGAVAKIDNSVTAAHIQAAAREYIAFRYNWTNQSIEKNLKLSEGFVYPSLLDSFRKSMVEVKRFVKDKNVTQRVYPQSIDVDLKAKTVSIVADRIDEFDSLKSATVLKVKLQIELDDPTAINPWGVFVAKETEGGE